jgi:uncharacterized protein YecE (DUF72 family)
VGCAIWAYKGWVGNFFPETTKAADFLREYSRRLTSVEGNTTFYATPSAETVARWAEQTPPGFQFCPKLPQTITHVKRLVDAQQDTESFLERMSGLGDRFGPLFIQLPPSFGPQDAGVLSDFLGSLPSTRRVCVEVRHRAWFSAAMRPRLNALLSQHNAARVSIDTRGVRLGGTAGAGIQTPRTPSMRGGPTGSREPAGEAVMRARAQKPDLPIQPDLTAGFAFVRLIMHPLAELNEPIFAEWAQRFAEWLAVGTSVYVFTHCPGEVQSPIFARELHARISALTPVDPLPADPVQGILL